MFGLYEDGLSLLSERLRQNWLQKLRNVGESDDSLTSLAWLYDMNPLAFELDFSQKVNDREMHRGLDHSGFTPRSASYSQQLSGSLLDPQVRLEYRTQWTGKPPFSYATLICLAMRELGKPKVTLSDIYGWIINNFAYYRHTDSSWQNSVRHNLSLNKCFEKVPRDKNERGKGGFWRVNPKHVDWLEANLAKCRRVAPPSGPPPPMPRSMLLQQQQHQLCFKQKIMASSVQLHSNRLPAVPHSSLADSHTNFPFGGLSSNNMLKSVTLSPCSGSSASPICSSLSSSPLSFRSETSPVSKTIYNTGVTVLHPNSSSSSYFVTKPIMTNLNDSTPLHLNPVPPQTVPVRRRKSPLLAPDTASDNLQNAFSPVNHVDNRYMDSKYNSTLEGERRMQILRKRLQPTVATTLSNRISCASKIRRNLSVSTNFGNHVTRESLKSTTVKDTHDQPSNGSVAVRIAQTGQPKSVLGSGQLHRTKRFENSDSALPTSTRNFPQRRRFSRWTLPRLKDSDRSYYTREIAKQISRNVNTEPHLSLEGDCSLNNLLPQLGEDEGPDCVWPPINRGSTQLNNNFVSQSTTLFPVLTTIDSMTPSSMGIRAEVNNTRQATLSAGSSASSSSFNSVSTQEYLKSSEHIIHDQMHCPVETQACNEHGDYRIEEQLINCSSNIYQNNQGDSSTTQLETSYNSTWDSVFLPEKSENDTFEQFLQSQTRMVSSSQVSMNDLFDNFDQETHGSLFALTNANKSTYNNGTPLDSSDVQQFLIPTSSPLLTGSDGDRLTRSPVDSSPFLGHFELDFDTLECLVNNETGSVPLDMDLSFNGSDSLISSVDRINECLLDNSTDSPVPDTSEKFHLSKFNENSSKLWMGDSQTEAHWNESMHLANDGNMNFNCKHHVARTDCQANSCNQTNGLNTPPME